MNSLKIYRYVQPFHCQKKNINQFDVSTQTYVAAAITAVNLESEEWRERRYFTDLTDVPKPGTYTKILDPNIHCERFMHPDNAALYIDKVKIQKEYDPGRFAYTPLMTRALEALEREQRDEYRQTMELRADLLTNYENESEERRREMLRTDPSLAVFTGKYLPRCKQEQVDHLLGVDTLEIHVNNEQDLPKIPRFEKLPILQLRFDGQAFDANDYDNDVMIMYHERWAEFYKADRAKRAAQYISPEIATDPDIVAEQYAPIDVTTNMQRLTQMNDGQSTITYQPMATVPQQTSGLTHLSGNVVVKQEPIDVTEDNGQTTEQEHPTATDGLQETEVQTVTTNAEIQTDFTLQQGTQAVTNVTAMEQQNKFIRGPLMDIPDASVMPFPAPRPTPEVRVMAEELLKTAHILATCTPAAKALKEKRLQAEQEDMNDAYNEPRQHLKWEYDEKFVTASKYLSENAEGIKALCLETSSHPDLEAVDEQLQRVPAAIDTTIETAKLTTARLLEIRRHLTQQDVEEWQDFNVYPTSNVNIGPYLGEDMRVPIVPYRIMPRNKKITTKCKAMNDECGFTNRDIEIAETLIKMMYATTNLSNAAIAELRKMWRDDSAEAIMNKEILIDACRVATRDTQRAAIELLCHMLTTRRLRSLRYDVNLSKDDVCDLLTSDPKTTSLY